MRFQKRIKLTHSITHTTNLLQAVLERDYFAAADYQPSRKPHVKCCMWGTSRHGLTRNTVPETMDHNSSIHSVALPTRDAENCLKRLFQ